MKSKSLLIILGFISVIIVGWFYWFQWRPSQIIKGCYKEIENMPGEIGLLMSDTRCKSGFESGISCVKHQSVYDNLFRTCLNKNGLR